MPEKTKYIIMVGDGMADYPVEKLGGKTPLMAARTPHMDRLAGQGEIGLVRTVPEGFNRGARLPIFPFSDMIPSGIIPAGAPWKRPVWASNLQRMILPSDATWLPYTIKRKKLLWKIFLQATSRMKRPGRSFLI